MKDVTNLNLSKTVLRNEVNNLMRNENMGFSAMIRLGEVGNATGFSMSNVKMGEKFTEGWTLCRAGRMCPGRSLDSIFSEELFKIPKNQD